MNNSFFKACAPLVFLAGMLSPAFASAAPMPADVIAQSQTGPPKPHMPRPDPRIPKPSGPKPSGPIYPTPLPQPNCPRGFYPCT